MKIFKMILFITALLAMPAVAFITGANLIGITFCLFYGCFAFVEIFAKIFLGRTVTQDTQRLTKGKMIALTITMIIGWVALLIHLWGAL